MIFVEFSYISISINEIMLIRRVLHETKESDRKVSIQRSEILIFKVDDLTDYETCHINEM